MYNPYNFEASGKEDILNKFRMFLYTEKISKGSIRSYISDTRHFLSWLEEFLKHNGIVSSNQLPANSKDNSPLSLITDHLKQVNQKLLETYRQHLVDTSMPEATINRRFSSLRRFGAFCQAQNWLKLNPFDILKNISKAREFKDSKYRLEEFRVHLWASKASKATIKNYLADVKQFLQSVNGGPKKGNLQDGLAVYKNNLVKKGLSPTSVERKLSSVKKYLKFLGRKVSAPSDQQSEKISLQTLIAQNQAFLASLGIKTKKEPSIISQLLLVRIVLGLGRKLKSATKTIPTLRYTIPYAIKYKRPKWVNYAAIAVLVLAAAVGGYFKFGRPAPEGQVLGLPTQVPTYLSFQGRLTDSFDTPITAPTHFRFAIYNDPVASGSAKLWEEAKWIKPDEDGIFNTLIGDTFLLDRNIFKDNTELWLGVTVNTNPEMTARQPIATVAYAFNSQFLQGYGIGTSGIANINNIPVINENGEIVIAAAGPSLKTTSGTFKIESPTLALMAEEDSGNIGIGISSAVNKLTISGGVSIGTTNPESAYFLATAPDGGLIVENSLGIGTISPEEKLHVVGNAYISQNLNVGLGLTAPEITLTNNAQDGNILVSDEYGNAKWKDPNSLGIGSTYQAGNGITLEGNTFKLGGSLSNHTTITQGDFNIIFNQTGTGNFGIGTTNPLHKFHVEESQADYLAYISNLSKQEGAGGLYIRNDGVGNILTLNANGADILTVSEAQTTINNPTFFAGSGDVSIANNLLLTDTTASFIKSNASLTIAAGEVFGSSNLTLRTYNAGNVIIESANLWADGNNVGIGTTNPTQKLEIAGSMRLQGALYDANNSAGQEGNLLISTGTGTSWIDTANISIGDADTLDGYHANNLPYVNNTSDSTLTRSGDGPYTLGLNLGNANTWTAKQTFGNIDVGGTAYFASNVGIGTTDPKSALDINGHLHVNHVIYGNNGLLSLAGYAPGSVTNSIISFFTSDGTTSAERMRIDRFGNVGIGTTVTSSYKLNVNGQINSTGFCLNGDCKTAWSEVGDHYWTRIGNLLKPSTDGDKIATTGNIGIGTTNPQGALHIASGRLIYEGSDFRIQGYSSADRVTLKGGNDGPYLELSGSTHSSNPNAATFGIGGSQNYEILLKDAPYTRFFTTRGDGTTGIGNLGNNTFTPQATLDIRSSATNKVALQVRGANGQTSNLTEWENYSGNTLAVIDANGNVGIGTDDPGSYKLYVNGDAYINGSSTIVNNLRLNGNQILNSEGTAAIMLSSSPNATWSTLNAGAWFVHNTSNLGKAALAVDQDLGGDIFTASASGQTKFIISNSGNVGIGTTNLANYTLNVGGDIYSSQAIIGANYGVFGESSRKELSNVLEAYKSGWGGIGMIGDNTDDIFYMLKQNDQFAYMFMDQSDANALTLQSSTHLKFFTDGDKERMRIDQASGNVGIGFTSPAHQLHVNGRIDQSWNYFFTDFFGSYTVSCDTSNAWEGIRFGENGACTGTIEKDRANGVFKLTTGGTVNDACNLDFNNQNQFDTQYNYVFETAVRVDVVSGQIIYVGITNRDADGMDDPTHGTYFKKYQNDTQWTIQTRYSSIGTTFPTGVDVKVGSSGPFQVLRIEASPASVKYYIDGILVHNETGTRIPPAGTALDLDIQNKATVGGARALYVDYIKIWQDWPSQEAIAGKTSPEIDQANQPISDFINQADLAENYMADFPNPPRPGEIVQIDPIRAGYVILAQEPYSQKALGIISESPDRVMGKGNNLTVPVGLLGRIRVKVSSENGSISAGDPITSGFTTGVGMKATKAGPVIGTALENLNCSESPCQGMILVAVNPRWFDPDYRLNALGDIVASQNDYNLVIKTGGIVEKIGNFAEAAVAKLKTGLIETQSLIADYVSVNKKIVAPNIETIELTADGAVFTRVNSDYIAPANGNDLIVDLKKEGTMNDEPENVNSGFGKLLVKGNAEFEGNVGIGATLETQDLEVKNELIANSARIRKLQAESIEGLEAIIATISSQYLNSNISGAEDTILNEQDSDLNLELSGDSSLSDQNDNGSYILSLIDTTGATSSASLAETARNWTVTDPSEDIKIESNVTIYGTTTLAQTIIAGPLTQDSTLLIDNGDSINVLGGILYLQNQCMGGIDLLAGKVTIDVEGNAVFEGDLTVKGSLFANMIKPVNGNITFDLSTPISSSSPETTPYHLSPNTGFGKILVMGADGEPVYSLDASGSAEFAGEVLASSFSINRPVIAAEPDFTGTIVSTASAGIAKVAAGRKEVTIKSPYVNVKSLIYLTPIGSTDNQVIYLARTNPSLKTFTAAIDRKLTKDILFSWWIVN